uniref:Uncharacterized protein n=1 Tax=Glossina austeni TaxID=7395 RepID=A0A1A9UEX8_GLOAU
MAGFTELCDGLAENFDISNPIYHLIEGEIVQQQQRAITPLQLREWTPGYLPQKSILSNSSKQHMPLSKTANLLEDLVFKFITEMTHKAREIRRTGRVQVEDIVLLVCKDARRDPMPVLTIYLQ